MQNATTGFVIILFLIISAISFSSFPPTSQSITIIFISGLFSYSKMISLKVEIEYLSHPIATEV
jgi:hypothetical protein